MKDILDIAGSVAGIGGLAIAAGIIIFRSVIAEFLVKHSPRLKRDQVFLLLNKIINFTFLIALFGLAAWVVGKYSGNLSVLSTVAPTVVEKELTEYKDFMNVPVQYGDITALKIYEQKWADKLKEDGNPNAEAKAFLIANQLVDIAWENKKNNLVIDQRIAELRDSMVSMNEQQLIAAQAQIQSLQKNIKVQSDSRKYQLLALYGKDRSVNNPVDTMHETSLLTDYSPQNRLKWYGQVRQQFSQIF